MTPREMLEELNEAGLEAGGDYHDGLDGWFEWKLGYENGDRVLTIVFSDHSDVDWETSGNNEMPRYEAKWRLTRVEA